MMHDVERAHAIMDEAATLHAKLKAIVWRLPPDAEAEARALITDLERTMLVYGYVATVAAMLPDAPPVAGPEGMSYEPA